ncbi:sulfurtransferase TusA family protein [Oceanobacillus kapialis]|uniref:Sulfurtransferase TusA family protein n=1 Tax=Oceanobacillus kapialis TaxID=481353 RepID=A0ABW5PWE9_9BACI
MNITKTLDAKGLACPMPVVKTKKAMDSINPGEILEVIATDKGALSDIPAWAKAGGHSILEQRTEENALYFYIQKG